MYFEGDFEGAKTFLRLNFEVYKFENRKSARYFWKIHEICRALEVPWTKYRWLTCIFNLARRGYFLLSKLSFAAIGKFDMFILYLHNVPIKITFREIRFIWKRLLMRCSRCGWDLAEVDGILPRAYSGLTANAKVATVLGSIPFAASFDTMESEGRQMKQYWYKKKSSCYSIFDPKVFFFYCSLCCCITADQA